MHLLIIKQLESELVKERSRGQNVKHQLITQRKTVDLLTNASENIAKLEVLQLVTFIYQ
jgi:hypothetical protein